MQLIKIIFIIQNRLNRKYGVLRYICIAMLHSCCVLGCSNNSKRDAHLSFFSLQLKKNKHVSICSDHFVQAKSRNPPKERPKPGAENSLDDTVDCTNLATRPLL